MSTKTIVSPMYMENHITRKEFNDFDNKVDKRFEAIDIRFDAVDERFEAIDRRFDAVDKRFEAMDRRFEAIDRRFDAVDQKFIDLRKELNEDYERHTGIILEQMRHDNQLALEHLNSVVEKKASKDFMFEYMEYIESRLAKGGYRLREITKPKI
ncbi:MAG: hypothetical protein NTZ38_03835 [Candidatus Taylorbacteria bacterium]|nr:hypothetical protein [Candidatus Taylorbacteria bacterium]